MLVARYGELSLLAALMLSGCGSTETVDLLPNGAAGNSHSGGSDAKGGITGQAGSAVSGGANGGSAGNPTAPSTSTTPRLPSLPNELIHLYDFSGSGTEITDLGGGTSGEVKGGSTLNGQGQLEISDGVSYVRLPSWLLSKSGTASITIATWVTWNGGLSWPRLFDFGATQEGLDAPGTAISQFYFTPKFEPLKFYSAVLAYDTTQGGQASVEGTEAFPIGVQTFVAVVVVGDTAANTSTLHVYVNGVEAGTEASTTLTLTSFSDPHCWLGQSQWVQDADPSQHFKGSFDEFRIYNRALSATEIQALVLSDSTKL